MPARRKSKSRSKSPRRVRRSSGRKARTSRRATVRRSPKRTYKGVDARVYGMQAKSFKYKTTPLVGDTLVLQNLPRRGNNRVEVLKKDGTHTILYVARFDIGDEFSVLGVQEQGFDGTYSIPVRISDYPTDTISAFNEPYAGEFSLESSSVSSTTAEREQRRLSDHLKSPQERDNLPRRVAFPTPTARGNVAFDVDDLEDLIGGLEEQIRSTQEAIFMISGDDTTYDELVQTIDNSTPANKLNSLSHIHESLISHLSTLLPPHNPVLGDLEPIE